MPRTWFKDMQEMHKICQLYGELTPIIFINLNMKNHHQTVKNMPRIPQKEKLQKYSIKL